MDLFRHKFSRRKIYRCWPPSTKIIWPVMESVSARKMQALATSSGFGAFFIGVIAICFAILEPGMDFGGSTAPGATAFTLILGAHCRAAVVVASARAFFDKAYEPSSGKVLAMASI